MLKMSAQQGRKECGRRSVRFLVREEHARLRTQLDGIFRITSRRARCVESSQDPSILLLD
jgi:hypothetical protein